MKERKKTRKEERREEKRRVAEQEEEVLLICILYPFEGAAAGEQAGLITQRDSALVCARCGRERTRKNLPGGTLQVVQEQVEAEWNSKNE